MKALLLQVGFYLLGLATVVGLTVLPLAQLRYQEQISIFGIASGCLGLWMAWALLPPRNRYQDPGPQLDLQALPALFEEVRSVAGLIGIKPPEEVYLTHEANAFISSRRAWFRRMHRLGIGLPLLHCLTTAELRAVIAHELGHQHKGDLRLGPWIYGTRQAIASSLDRMDQDGVGLHLLFHWYGKLYIRISQAISRRQELHADTMAGSVCGSEAATSALRRIAEVAPLWDLYWYQECLPVLECGLRPPILAGFDLFMQQTTSREIVAQIRAGADKKTAGLYDSHPSLAERCRSLASAQQRASFDDGTPRSKLLDESKPLEETLVRFLAIGHKAFPTVAWTDVGVKVWLPRWRSEVAPYQRTLSSLDAAGVGRAISELDLWAKRLRPAGPAILSPEAGRRRVAGLLGLWLCLLLDRRGWPIEALPGAGVSFATSRGATFEPLTRLAELQNGELSQADWLRICQELNL
jgi:Zn-dependent protease with chaperone function